MIDPADRCPVCRKPNGCALAEGQESEPCALAEGDESEPCWCVGREFPADLLERAGDPEACICEACRAEATRPRPSR